MENKIEDFNLQSYNEFKNSEESIFVGDSPGDFTLKSTEPDFIKINSERLINVFKTIDTTVTASNIEKMSKISVNINRMAKDISDKRIAWKKEVTAGINAEEKLIKDVHVLLSEKREEIKNNAEKFKAVEKAARVQAAKDYFESQLKNYSIYEWITFDGQIYESSLENKGGYTYEEDGSIKSLAKKTRDLIDSKLEKFSNDRLTIDTFCEHTGDSTALVTYQSNALKSGIFDSLKAIKYAEQVIEKNKELAAFKAAKQEVEVENKEIIKEEVKQQTKVENKAKIYKKKNTTTITVEISNDMKVGFIGMLRTKGIKFEVEGE